MTSRIAATLAGLFLPLFGTAVYIQGGVQLPQRGTVPGTTPALSVTDVVGARQVAFFAALASTNYNGIVQAGDSALIYSAGTSASGALDIAPYASSGSTGVRFNGSGGIAFYGGATASGSASFDLSGSSGGEKTTTGAFTSAASSFSVAMALPTSGVLSSSFNVSNGSAAATSGNDYPLGGFSILDTNTIRANFHWHKTASSAGWTNGALCLASDVDTTPEAGGIICMNAGNVSVGNNSLQDYSPTHTLETTGTFYVGGASTLNGAVTVSASASNSSCSLSTSKCTATVTSGCKPQCTYQSSTTAAYCSCSVSTTTLSAVCSQTTGTVMFHCF